DGYKLPISLNYHASGIRVDQEATWVGLGWSLDAGSRISRTINGSEDFMESTFDRNHPFCEKGYYYAPDIGPNFDNQYRLDGIDACPNWGTEYHLICDPEPDIFYYNLPGGINGKFILDKSRGAVLFDKSHNLKIEVTKNRGESSVWFKITDSEGNQYLYSQTEITQNYTEQNPLNKNLNSSNTKYDDDITSYIYWRPFTKGQTCGEEVEYDAYPQTPDRLDTSWCLSKIITKNEREINFTYDTEVQYLPTQESSEKYWRPVYGGQDQQSFLAYYRSKVVNVASRLKSIQGDFGRVDFTCSERYDIKGTAKKLDQILIRNSNNALLKSFKFEYSYFNDDYTGNAQYVNVFKRLKLNKVTEYSSLDEPLNKGHLLDYYPGSFPAKNSKNVDYWGFQNGKDYGENYVIGINIGNSQKFIGIKKEANFQKAIIGTLNKITYPTGGTAEFKFESNIIPSGYFKTYTADIESSTNDVRVDVYKHYIMNEFPNALSQDIYRFEIKGKTELTIGCYMENFWRLKDPTYNYDHPNYPLGVLKRISPAPATLYSQVCPYIFSESTFPGQGVEITMQPKKIILEAGTYEFVANTPPKDVYASWKLHFDYLYTPIITNGNQPPDYDGGGIRISEIKTDAKIRKFKYPTANIPVNPIFHYSGRIEGLPYYFGQGIIQTSESRTPLSAFNRGNAVGYDWVEESLTDEEGDVSTIRTTFYNDDEEIIDRMYPNSPAYINYTNGLTKSIEKFTTKKGSIARLVEKEDFIYTSTYSNIIKAFKDREQNKVDFLTYNYILEWPLPTQVIKTEKTDDGKSIISETNYTYNAKDLLASTSYNV
ncbi:hypothetical protein, partial [Flavobacterium salmonis]|uniref:hypothetical protein n=1 Tax=Flavobacterium salmonis TaxID=2654844 RepID=UPI003616C1F9